jgi:phage shock protein C
MKDQTKHLYRSRSNKTLAGVCGGIAEYFGFDPTVIRLLWVVLTLFGGSGILLYVIAYFVMPVNPDYSIPPPHSVKSDFTAGKVIGVFLMFIGVMLLLDNLDIFSFHSFWHESWEFVLPAIFVFAGIALLLRAERKEEPKADPNAAKPAGSADQTSAEPKDAGQAEPGEQAPDQANFTQKPQQRQLRRSRFQKKIFGICGGLGEYFDIDPTIVRLVYVFFTFLSAGTGVILYVLMYLIIPEEAVPATK